ncbi:PREDICTED: uncharacterized protein LOC105449167 [Wasmannia auropunctata]|uniref:uncharacterized protein LOC105449167 n=1 Tax=Wasmannia auropunctata TaxID=64793 RepID=UPI0005EF5160|nr:PREDICTED: uncharacterized protein LOC105449167 [Wasmannia auropunctata]
MLFEYQCYNFFFFYQDNIVYGLCKMQYSVKKCRFSSLVKRLLMLLQRYDPHFLNIIVTQCFKRISSIYVSTPSRVEHHFPQFFGAYAQRSWQSEPSYIDV